MREVNYAKAGFEPLKVTAIKELPMGTNSKLHVQFDDRFWYGAGNNGNTYADTGYQNTWEVTRAQGGKKGILVDYTGGNVGASFGSGTPLDRAQQFLDQLAPQFPGVILSDHWDQSISSVAVDYWAGLPVDEGLVLVLEGRAVHEVLRDGEGPPGELPLRRRAHLAGLPGLPERRRRDRRAGRRRDPRRPEARLMAVSEHTASDRVVADRERYVARGVATTPLVVARAEGARIWDVDGREYVDFAGGLGCQNTGHGFAAAAIHEQVDRYLHQCFMVGMYESVRRGVQAARRDVARRP